MKILMFAASNRNKSINKKLIQYVANLLQSHDLEILDINDFEMPIYNQDIEDETGIPHLATEFLQKIAEADALVISFAEHNGGLTVAFKNLFDWTSRINRNLYQGKPLIMLAASPGKGGAKRVLQTSVEAAPIFGGKVLGSMSVPSFNENFDQATGKISNKELQDQLETLLSKLES